MLMVGGNANFYELFDAAFLPVLLGNVAGGFAMVDPDQPRPGRKELGGEERVWCLG
jgi:hypothetical protein